MVLPLLKDICRPHVIDIIMLLKRGSGMSVNELSAALRMSYMGVKQHCILLDKKGYLSTWLRPKTTGGRPEKMYRLAPKMDALFPSAAGQLAIDMLEAAAAAYGEASPEHLLSAYFQHQTNTYLQQIKGRTLVERAGWLAKTRLNAGCLSYSEFDAHLGLRIVEFHTPIVNLIARFPIATGLEEKMFSRVLQCQVERIDTSFDNVTRIEFRLRPHPE